MKNWQLTMRAAWAVGLFLLAACCPQTCPSAGESAMTDGTVLNSSLYGDPQNRSFMQVTGRISGEEVFHAKAEEIAQQTNPIGLAIANDKLIIGYGNYLTCLSREDGSLRWNRSIRGNHIFQVTDNGILTLDLAAQHVLLSLDNKPGEETYLASVHEETFLHLLTTLADGSWGYIVEQFPEPMSEPDDEPENPFTRFVRYHPEQMDVRWEYEMPPEPHGVAITADGARLFVAFEKSLYIIPIDGTSDDDGTITEFTDIRSLSTDGNGNALVADVVDRATELKQVKPDGSIGWTVTFDNTDVTDQPAASTPDGIIYIVVANTLHQVRDGELRWSYPLKASTSDIKITVLSDNSVLVAAGTALVQVSDSGEEILMKLMNSTIRTRPVMDENEKVYFGADDGIHCLK